MVNLDTRLSKGYSAGRLVELIQTKYESEYVSLSIARITTFVLPLPTGGIGNSLVHREIFETLTESLLLF